MDRNFCVRINNNLSEYATLISGVPQGSVLGPLIFLVFICDLGIDLEESVIKILKYVDDTKVLGVTNTSEDVLKF